MPPLDASHAHCLPKNRNLFYGGGWHKAKSGRVTAIESPSTQESLGDVADADTQDVNRAVESAFAAFSDWRDASVQERARAIREAAAIMLNSSQELSYLEALDTGNPYQAMLYDVEISAGYMDYFAGLVLELKGVTIPVAPKVFNYTLREPLGVVARIGAFNHPLLFVAGKMAAPLAAGNTIVFKPAEITPLTSLRLAELWEEVFPPGVFNIITGGREAGEALTEHPKVAKVGFIGSINVGRAVMRSASNTLKPLTLELGGKNALVACADAAPDEVADGVVRGMNFRYVTGQSCNSTSRVFLHDEIYDAALPAIIDRVSRVKIGLPTDPTTEMGCLSSRAQLEKTLRYIQAGIDEGARLIYGGKVPTDPQLANGLFVEPTIFTDVTDNMRIAREEVFGPVLSILRWSDEEDVVRRINALDYGLTSSIWTRDLSRAHRLAASIQAGYIWINNASIHYPGVPFGGYKQSGMGREESIEEILACTQIKNVHVNLQA